MTPYSAALGVPPGARLVIVVAHPDDETIGAGGLLASNRNMVASGTFDVHLIGLTDGAPRDGGDAAAAGCADWRAYAGRRRRELQAALAIIGLPPERAESLNIPDQQAAEHLVPLAHRLADRFAALAPDAVLTHPYEGGHPDHDAAAFAVRAACALLARNGGRAPRLVEMAFYHHAAGTMTVQDFLPHAGFPARTVTLDSRLRAVKRRMLDAHASQADVLSMFGAEAERFRPAPPVDFTRPPHAGPLQYEAWGFAMDGPRWRRHAAAASAAIGLELGT
ncbi:MAG TPA: PIG-L family deacetylase [Azospirillum sp.]|nr:PIG-L family deacetylase [Azospirillum sp.]